MALFSVIIPVFNRDPTKTLESVKAQTLTDWECLVVDDGSACGGDVASAVETMRDNRFRYIRQENKGANAARNNGIDRAAGKFVAFLDSDDEWLPEKLEIQAEQLKSGGVAYSQFYFERGTGIEWVRPRKAMESPQDVAKYLFVQNQFIQTSTIALPTNIARKVRWDETLRKGQDLDFALRLKAAGCRFDFMPRPLVIFLDNTETGRVSRVRGIDNHLDFLSRNADRLSWRGRHAYRATYMTYDLGEDRPLLAIWYLLVGLAVGVSPVVVARKAVRAFVPPQRHRKVVDFVVCLVKRRSKLPGTFH